MGNELDLLGQWPFPREELEKMKEGVYIPREKILRFIHGKKNNTRIDFYVSNDLFHVGKMVIPAKGSSDIEVHNGDEVIYVLKGTLNTRIYNNRASKTSVINEGYLIYEDEKFLIPRGLKHRYFNFDDEPIEFLLAVASWKNSNSIIQSREDENRAKDEPEFGLSIPSWQGKYPFSPEEKKPAVLRKQDAISMIYGREPDEIRCYIYISTDEITLSDYWICPGAKFSPPDIHTGDEFYYVRKGTLTLTNPDTGRTYEIKKDEAFLIPKNIWHQGFNFGNENVQVLTIIAPSLWSTEERGTEIAYTKKPVRFTGRLQA